MKPFQIFKPGRHTAMDGKRIEFTDADLKASAAAYDPAKHEAPIVIGHPKGPAPAFGWIDKLAFADDRLVAEPKQVEAAFEELVRDGRYKQRSAAFYLPDADSNPVPGVYYLQHVAFLGAAAPSVKGLAPVEFEGGDADVITVQFGEMGTVAGLFRSLASTLRAIRDVMIEDKGVDKVDEVLPAWRIDDLVDGAARIDERPAAFSEQPPQRQETEIVSDKNAKAVEEAAQFEEQKKRLADDQAKLETDKAAFAEAKRHADAAQVIDGLVKDGKVLPAEKQGLAKFMAGLDGDKTVEFGEGDAGKATPKAYFEAFLKGLPKRVDFTERAGADGQPPIDAKDPAAVAQEAVAYQETMKAKGIIVPADKAVRHVLAQAAN